MLKKILRDMYVDPEILAGLDETQKQTLFCKMREEQIRRWRIWDHECSSKLNEENTSDTEGNDEKRKVSFRPGPDGEPWVWVMGEHKSDRSIEQILADEAKQKARELAEIETLELRKTYEAELSDIIAYDETNNKKQIEVDSLDIPQIEDMEIYCTVDELRERINQSKSVVAPPSMIHNNIVSNNNHKNNNSFQKLNNIYNNRLTNFNLTTCQKDNSDVLKEISNKPANQKVSARIALWEKRVIGEKTNEIYRRIQKKQQDAVKEAEEAAKNQESFWLEQQRKSKEAEEQTRQIARRAREEYRKSIDQQTLQQDQSMNTSPLTSLDSSISRPPNQDAVVKWYREEEFYRNGGMDGTGTHPAKWFHGLITRMDAERVLAVEPAGTFLIRLSEKIWGYAISYKCMDRCKHYLVDASSGRYQFLGANQLIHDNLNDLIKFHANVPITMAGNELLLRPCSPSIIVPKVMDGLI